MDDHILMSHLFKSSIVWARVSGPYDFLVMLVISPAHNCWVMLVISGYRLLTMLYVMSLTMLTIEVNHNVLHVDAVMWNNLTKQNTNAYLARKP